MLLVVVYSIIFLALSIVAYNTWLQYRGVNLPYSSPIETGGETPDFIIVVLLDGASSPVVQSYIRSAETSVLLDMGLFLPNGRSVYPSYSGPSRASILTGVPPAVHGVVSNEGAFKVKITGLIDLAREKGFKIINIGDGLIETIFGVKAVAIDEGAGQGSLALKKAVEVLRANLSNGSKVFIWVTVNDVDVIGHKAGGFSKEYNATVKNYLILIAGFISEISDVLNRGVVVVLSDHGFKKGGHHGGGEDTVMNTFMFIAGRGIAPGVCYEEFLLIDIAPSLGILTSIGVPPYSMGKALATCLGINPTPAEMKRKEVYNLLGTRETVSMFTDQLWIRLFIITALFIPLVLEVRRIGLKPLTLGVAFLVIYIVYYVYSVRVYTFSDIYSFTEVMTKIIVAVVVVSFLTGLFAARFYPTRGEVARGLIGAYLFIITVVFIGVSTFLVPYGPVVVFPNPDWDFAVRYFAMLITGSFSGLVGMPIALVTAILIQKNR
ncbi:type I phosphodiesterase/nucleotide pyrophosphatase [Pyrobaculum arsenaticum DSM 13514]|uniref:Type I phosphodiesterase/nucleotide pyrophosphatase n=1 Tax=Pyrobaculum arsenaticum (strain DSM 13514 / JCM 11321 / PZ6) TaxID=340102 RepID=A4WKP5_PYRAR|nr:type I phosphodiesterase/nucleotide pyrophosphatase [Pyrobaculum arsenaticum DSM 13514]